MKVPHSLRVTQVIPQGTEAVLLSFAIEAEQEPHFIFKPGQYLTLAANVEGNDHWRCYSITSPPVSGEPISVLVRRVAGGVVSNWICDNIQVGDRMDVLPPAGSFTLARPGEAVLLYAGGSGIAPTFALARHALAKGAQQVVLFYANRDRATMMLHTELEDLRRESGDRFSIQYWFDDEQGLPSQKDLRDIAVALDGVEKGVEESIKESADVYLCGPELFMKAVCESLEQTGINQERVHSEDFGAEMDEDSSGEEGAESSMVVKIKGEEHTVPVNGQQSLLSAMLNAGLPAPHACRVGECASCICSLEQGEIDRLESSVLDEDDEEDGWLLACRARAISKTLKVRFVN